MNKFYLIVPIIALAAFIAYYTQYSKDLAHREQIQAEQQAAAARQEALDKQKAIEKAAADAEARAEAQREADAKAEAEHLQKWQDSMKQMADEKAKYQASADNYAKQVADLDLKLDQLHNDHAKASRDLFDMQKQVELLKITRREAELEIQRTYDMVTQKVTASTLANFTPPAAKK